MIGRCTDGIMKCHEIIMNPANSCTYTAKSLQKCTLNGSVPDCCDNIHGMNIGTTIWYRSLNCHNSLVQIRSAYISVPGC